MKKILVILTALFTLASTEKSHAQSLGYFVVMQNDVCIQDSTAPVINTDSSFISPRYATVYPKYDSITHILIGQGSKSASNKSDSLIIPIQFKNAYASGIMDFGFRADSAGIDSIMIYQNNVKIYTYNGGAQGFLGHFKLADVYFPFTSGAFMVPTRFVIKPVLSRSSSKKRKIWINLNYYQQ